MGYLQFQRKKELHAHKFGSLDEMYQCLKKLLLQLTQNEAGTLNSPIIIKETEFVILKHPSRPPDSPKSCKRYLKNSNQL